MRSLSLKQNKMNFSLLHHFDSGLTENDINKRHTDEDGQNAAPKKIQQNVI